jgi:outer membrane lipoprotein LolB
MAMQPLGRHLLWAAVLLLAACATTRPPGAGLPGTGAPGAVAWELRLAALQQTDAWELEGRAAAALGTQGWQASLTWMQTAQGTEVHLSGPLGVGANVLRLTAAGLSVNGAPPNADVLDQLRQRLGFDLPLGNLRFWLLGVPDPGLGFDLVKNAQDRAQQLTQAGWTISFERYVPVNGDVLPGRLVLTRADARIRIAVDRWNLAG